ncbi:malate and lactate dehydrogenase [Holotrichia oblita]|uniref:Malate and lactate dehydrogenase n=1 Tax=Holotrichia oblita TaxID=644536 RepID=A0ACB9SQD5_HOLOL|nr:malate and lactate dehydrogenase [Holotrichia oblita]
MLLATPFLHIDKVLSKDGPPRVISEVKKSQIGVCREQTRPRLSADLFVRYGSEQQWWPRRVAIRGGQLLVGSVHGETKYGSVRIPLRRLSLSAGKLVNSLSLIKGQNILLTIQTPNERSFDLWVKAIAIELIRQTPLEDVKYFDILTIDDNWRQKLNEEQRDLNFNCIQQTERCNSCSAISTTTEEAPKYTTPSYPNTVKYDNRTLEAPSRYKRSNLIRNVANYTSQRSQIYHRNVEKTQIRIRSRSCNSIAKDDTDRQDFANTKPQITVTFDQTNKEVKNDEKAFELLLKKCQNHENYVPVKEKLLLFETLCKLGRQVSRSTEDVHLKVEIATKRAKSLHDLHSVSCAGVKQICRYFENKCESKSNDKRLIHSDSHLNTIQRFKSFGLGIQGA